MKTVRVKIEPPKTNKPLRLGRISAKFARHVRRRLGFSQAEFATRIDVSLETIRNWEQGKRCPTGAAKALLKVLDKAPEAALAALH
jgi:putative transcriptional regulator